MRAEWLLRLAICATYAAIILALMIDVGTIDDASMAIFAALFYVWAIAPVALLAVLRSLGITTAIGAILIGAVGVYYYWRALYGPDIDPQSGLILIFFPIYQFAGVVACAVLAAVISSASTKAEA